MRFVYACVLLAAVGCSEAPKKAERLAVKDVPENLMTIAKEKLPGVTFDQVIRKSSGVYEIIGKDETGKVREVELTPEGEVVEIE
jgi:hypothetical protein